MSTDQRKQKTERKETMKTWLIRIGWIVVLFLVICPMGPVIFGGGIITYLACVLVMLAICVKSGLGAVVWNKPGCHWLRWSFLMAGTFVALLFFNSAMKSQPVQSVKAAIASAWNAVTSRVSNEIRDLAPDQVGQKVGAATSNGLNSISQLFNGNQTRIEKGRVVVPQVPFIGIMEYDITTNWSRLVPVDPRVNFSLKANQSNVRLQIKVNESDAPEDNIVLPAQSEPGYASIVAAVGNLTNVTTLQFMIPQGSLTKVAAVQVETKLK